MKLDRQTQYACDTRTQNLPFLSASIGNPRKWRGYLKPVLRAFLLGVEVRGHVLCGVSQKGLARLKVFTSFFDGQCQDALAFAFRSVVSICEVHVCRGMG